MTFLTFLLHNFPGLLKKVHDTRLCVYDQIVEVNFHAVELQIRLLPKRTDLGHQFTSNGVDQTAWSSFRIARTEHGV